MNPNPLRLEFAPGARPIPWAGIAALALSAALAVAAAAQLRQVLASQARQAATLSALQARRQAPATARAAPATPGEAARIRAVRKVAQTLRTPWADLLESLEAAPSQAVALLSVEPSVGKRSLRLTAEARTADDMLDYVAALQRSGQLKNVVLVSHEVQARAPGAPWRFQVQAAWGAEP